MIEAIEVHETRATEQSATDVLNLLGALPGFLGGRLWTSDRVTWEIVGYFDDEGVRGTEFLPRGCRQVQIPFCLAGWFGINLGDDGGDDMPRHEDYAGG